MVDKENYDIVVKALELACDTLNESNISADSDYSLRVLSHKINGSLVGFYLMEAEKQLTGKEI